MRIKFFSIIFILLFFTFFCNAKSLRAGFGVSPPNIISDIVRPGTTFEKTVYLLRSSSQDSKSVEVSVSAPEIDSWISFDRERQFVLPEDQLNVPLKVIIKVPADADIGNYRGKIYAHVFSGEEKEESGLSVATGAEINIDLTLTKEVITDFSVLDAKINDYVIRKKPFDLPLIKNFFSRLRLDLKIENRGNIKAGPDKLSIDVYDITQNDFYGSAETVKLKKIDAFQITENSVSLPLSLEPGQYWGKVKIYSGDKVIYANSIAFSAIYAKESAYFVYVFYLIIFLTFVATCYIFYKKTGKNILQKILLFMRNTYKAISGKIGNVAKRFWRKIFEISDKKKD